MKLSTTIIELGRAVAYYPGLKKVTQSTTATILLCQFLYWASRTRDGWIYKTTEDIEEETGLTYFEQKTAKDKLVEIGVLDVEFKRLQHISRYRVNEPVLNRLWEEVSSKPYIDEYKEKEIEEKEEVIEKEEEVLIEPPEQFFARKASERVNPDSKSSIRNPIQKKGDLIDGLVAFSKTPGMVKEGKLLKIKETVEKKFHIRAEGKRWKEFIEFVYVRENNHAEDLEIFIKWALENGFNPIYWTPEKMKTVWPTPFAEIEKKKEVSENFISSRPSIEEEEYAPMPEELRKKRLI